jgi:hypothetical protein
MPRQYGVMISNTSLSAFSAAELRPVRPPLPPAERPPVDPVARVDQVRSQTEAPRAQQLLAPGGSPPAPNPDRPMPRGSLLDLSV